MTDLRAKSLMTFFAVAGLAGAAISSRILGMINESPEFYSIYRMDRLSVTLFLILAGAFVPLAIGAIAWSCARFRATAIFSALIFVTLAALTLAGVLRDFTDHTGGWTVLAASAVLGIAAFYGFLRLEFVRIFMAATVLAIPVTLYNSSKAAGLSVPELWGTNKPETATTGENSHVRQDMPNIVFIVFDELPLTTLLNKTGEIDRRRFPNLRSLADSSTWFRQTSSVSCTTDLAVPAILSGKLFGRPKPERASPVLQNYPRNLFTLLGKNYDVRAWESLTQLCPTGLCGAENEEGIQFALKVFTQHLGAAWLHATLPVEMAPSLPDLDAYWMEAAAIQDVHPEGYHRKLYPVRVQQFQALVKSIVASDTPWLRFGHFLMPHTPFENLPDGTPYFKGGTVYGIEGNRWGFQSEHIDESYFRHILQTMFVDKLIGELVSRLREVGEYESTTIVIVADHGVSFLPGDTRRVTNDKNYPDLIAVPFILKRAGESKGAIVDKPVQTIDVLPTLIGTLSAKVDSHVFDGRDVLSETSPAITERQHFCSGSKYLSFETEMLSSLIEQVSVRDGKFGSRPDGTLEMNFAAEPDWIGRKLEDIGRVEISQRVARLRGLLPEEADGADNAPVYLNGGIIGSAPVGSDDLLFVATLNDQIASVMPAVKHKQQPRIISLMLQPRYLREGSNSIELYAVDRQSEGEVVFLKLKMSGVVRERVTDRIVYNR